MSRWRLAWALVGALAIALGAQISVPMVPVPTTLQTLALVVCALLGGPRVGGGAALVYLALAVAGLPVLADGASHAGLGFLEVKSAGYVVGFVPAAIVAGRLAQARGGFRSWLVAGLAAHGVVFLIGVPVLASWVGWAVALEHGLVPFLPGALAKSALGACAWYWRRYRRP